MSPRRTTPVRASGSESATRARFEERASQARWQRWRRLLVLLGVVAVVAALGWLVGVSSVLGVEKAQVEGEDRADTRAVTRIAMGEQGRPLARVDTGALEEQIAREVPGVRRARVSREWPNTLRVKVTSRVPALAVRLPSGKTRLVDLEGVSYREVTRAPADVPVVASDPKGSSDTLSAEGVDAALGMLRALPDPMREKVRDVVVDGADQVTFRLGRTEVVWGDGASAAQKVKVVEILLAKKPKVIDVTAPENPVTR